MITMTLSTADATAHLVKNPFTPDLLIGHNVALTLVLLALLGGVFLIGFREIGIAVALVATYLALNLVVAVICTTYVVARPGLVTDWTRLLVTEYPNPLMMLVVAVVVFPKLALGLSGFETGVAVMPLIKGDDPTPRSDRSGGFGALAGC